MCIIIIICVYYINIIMYRRIYTIVYTMYSMAIVFNINGGRGSDPIYLLLVTCLYDVLAGRTPILHLRLPLHHLVFAGVAQALYLQHDQLLAFLSLSLAASHSHHERCQQTQQLHYIHCNYITMELRDIITLYSYIVRICFEKLPLLLVGLHKNRNSSNKLQVGETLWAYTIIKCLTLIRYKLIC